jgi:hypothetical protein
MLGSLSRRRPSGSRAFLSSVRLSVARTARR